jgi:type VI secretion system protein ImpF
MAKQSRHKRLSPPLMFAFRSHAERRSSASPTSEKKVAPEKNGASPSRALADRRFASKMAVSESLLRAEVLKDMTMLVNTTALESSIDLRDLPHLRTSILNYGVPDIASRTLGDEGVEDISGEFETAFRTFEPRLVSGTVVVTRDTSIDDTELRVRFVVRGDLACHPVNVPVEFVADVEIDSRKIVIERL